MRSKSSKKITLLVGLLVTLNAFTFASPSTKNFSSQNEYLPNTFIDIPTVAWYASDVKKVYELGLMGGKGSSQFDPDGNLLVSEAISMVARVHHIYNGGTGVIPSSGTRWYDGAVKYSVDNHIFNTDLFSDYNVKITRAQMAAIFSVALPTNEYEKISTVEVLPDVTKEDDFYYHIIKLYEAGIVSGSDSKGTFKPDSQISRAEAAAIINRLVFKNERKAKSFLSNANLFKDSSEEFLNEYFYYNGVYYPTWFWRGETEAIAKERLLVLYRNMKTPELIENPSETDYVNASTAYQDFTFENLQSELVYEIVVKDILEKYPILVTGTVEEQSKRQLEQMAALFNWMYRHTNYKYDNESRDIDLLSFTSGTLMEEDWSEIYNALNDKYVHPDGGITVENSYKYNKEMHEILNAKKTEHITKIIDAISKGMVLGGDCDHFSGFVQQALPLMGIETMQVSSDGSAYIEPHAWNVVKLANGAIFYVDTTSIGDGLDFNVFEASKNNMGVYSADGNMTRNLDATITSSNERLYKLVKGGLYSTPRGAVFPKGDLFKAFNITTENLENFILWKNNITIRDHLNNNVAYERLYYDMDNYFRISDQELIALSERYKNSGLLNTYDTLMEVIAYRAGGVDKVTNWITSVKDFDNNPYWQVPGQKSSSKYIDYVNRMSEFKY